jgi:glycerophosphoryl diester phosphodiesterase
MSDTPRRPSYSIGLSSNRIAHAGGRINDKTYSNSIEAVESSLDRGFTAIELDVLQCADGFIVAHDGMEAAYGVTSLPDVQEAEFNARARVYKTYTPVTFSWLAMKSRQAPQVRWVIDSKVDGPREFGALLQRLAREGLQGSAIPQVYNVIDAAVAISHGFDVILFALWKHFATDPLSEQSRTEVDRIQKLKPRWLGLSVRHLKWNSTQDTTLDDSRFHALAKSGSKIFFHAIKSGHAEELSKSWGIFTE